MDFFHKNQKSILIVVLMGAGLYFYLTYFKPDGAVVVPQNATAEEVGAEVLSLYNSLQSVTLDQSIFNYSLYKNLVDFSTPIPYQTPGRSNPFNPIGQD